MKPLYATPFDIQTKVCTGPSQPLHISDWNAAKKMFGGAPDAVTQNTMIFNQSKGQALCVSHTRFSL